ncbi:hypothetical protein [Variovorax sp. RA8]|uniref:hypothetical protein n=1 Tax=Variovorax sp. (strain JCM 16519 / RA8) TaxID=662548 RepID=UPI000A6DF742|nr:hypothetical protein [Variovorax sp. RA8]VTU32069.1 hypothetical protein RA8CHR_04484 [Variovorax sp. RA8]
MTHQNQTRPDAPPVQIRITVETLDCKGKVQRRISLCNDFPAWAQERAIEYCLLAASTTAGNLLMRALPVLQVGTGANVTELDPLDYNSITREPLTAQEKVLRIFTSSLSPDFSKRAAELGISSLNVDENTPEPYLELIAKWFTTWKLAVRASDAASRSGGC